MSSTTASLISTLRFLVQDGQNNDSLTNLAIAESAVRLAELHYENANQGLTIAKIRDIVTNDKMSTKGKVLAIQHILREEEQP